MASGGFKVNRRVAWQCIFNFFWTCTLFFWRGKALSLILSSCISVTLENGDVCQTGLFPAANIFLTVFEWLQGWTCPRAALQAQVYQKTGTGLVLVWALSDEFSFLAHTLILIAQLAAWNTSSVVSRSKIAKVSYFNSAFSEDLDASLIWYPAS